MAIYLVKTDIRDMHCDAIVTATDTVLSGSRGIDRDIHEAAGAELELECARLRPQEVGSAVITSGYGLSKYIIHTVSPVWSADTDQSELLTQCFRNAFRLAKENRCASLATPHIASGGFGFPPDEVLRIAVREAEELLSTYNMDIYIITHRQSTFNMGTKIYEELLTRINDKKYTMHAGAREESLERLINQHSESFKEMLFRKIDEKGMTNSECYNTACVSRSVFNNIVNKPDYKPKKKTVTALVLALELPYNEALEMFGKAGYYLTSSNRFDLVVEFCIEHGIYNVFDVNEQLDKYAEDSLFN